jgi:hypothetical protein
MDKLLKLGLDKTEKLAKVKKNIESAIVGVLSVARCYRRGSAATSNRRMNRPPRHDFVNIHSSFQLENIKFRLYTLACGT